MENPKHRKLLLLSLGLLILLLSRLILGPKLAIDTYLAVGSFALMMVNASIAMSTREFWGFGVGIIWAINSLVWIAI